VSGMMRLDGQRYCAVCGEQKMEELHRPETSREVVASADGCAMCGSSGPLQRVAGATLCVNCAQTVYKRDFPKWLKMGLAFALVLLVVALVHGAKYFRIGADLYRGEKALERGKYEDAEKQLKPVVAFAPNCKKCSLLCAKAALLSGNPEEAYSATEGKNFEEDELFREVDGIGGRASKGLHLLQESAAKADANQRDEAVRLLKEAQAAYPEYKHFREFESNIEVSSAFNSKDYDKFLELEKADAESRPDDSMALAALASALACKYAVTGNPEFSRAAEEALQKAKSLAGNDPQMVARYQEYSERIEYRLKTREIIDKTEYDKRFRPDQIKKEAK
jgi:hypothetical protein